MYDIPFLIEDADRHGNVRRYVRKPHCRKIRIHEEPGTEAFYLAYAAALPLSTPTKTPTKAFVPPMMIDPTNYDIELDWRGWGTKFGWTLHSVNGLTGKDPNESATFSRAHRNGVSYYVVFRLMREDIEAAIEKGPPQYRGRYDTARAGMTRSEKVRHTKWFFRNVRKPK